MSRPRQPIAPGVLLDGRYRVAAPLGRGAMGSVWRARDEAVGRDVAVKTMLASDSPRRAARFLREGEATARLNHPGIVRVHAAGQEQGQPWLIYELIEGARSLELAMREAPLRQRVSWIRDLARALGYAHQRGVVHRDVKPDNALVDVEGRVRVTDFGLALHEDAERLTRSDAVLGTPRYLAPEQLTGDEAKNAPTCDVWALGVILYEALCDESPFPGESLQEVAGQIRAASPPRPSSLAPEVPPALEALCLRALAARPGDRPQDGEALAAGLDAWLEGRASTRAARPLAAAAGSAATLLLAGALVALAWDRSPPGPALAPPSASPSPAWPPPAPAHVATAPEVAGAPESSTRQRRLSALRHDANADGSVAYVPEEERVWVATILAGGRWDLASGALERRWEHPRLEIAFHGLWALPGRAEALIGYGSGLYRVGGDRPRALRAFPDGDPLLGAGVLARGDRVLLALGLRGRLLLCELRGAELEPGSERVLDQGEVNFSQAGFSPDGSRLLVRTTTAGDTEGVRCYDVASGRTLARWDQLEAGAKCLAWSPDGSRFALGLRSGSVLVGTTGSEELVPFHAEFEVTERVSLRLAHMGALRGLVFSRDGRLLLSAARDHESEGTGSTIKVWRLPEGDLAARLPLPGQLNAFALSGSGREAAIACDDGTFLLVSLPAQALPADQER